MLTRIITILLAVAVFNAIWWKYPTNTVFVAMTIKFLDDKLIIMN